MSPLELSQDFNNVLNLLEKERKNLLSRVELERVNQPYCNYSEKLPLKNMWF